MSSIILIKNYDLQGHNVGQKLKDLDEQLNIGKTFSKYYGCKKLQDAIDILREEFDGMSLHFRDHNLYGFDENYFEYSFNNSEYSCRDGFIKYTFYLINRSIRVEKFSPEKEE